MLPLAELNIEIGISLGRAKFLAVVIDFAIKIGFDMNGGCVAHGIDFCENRLPFVDERRLKMSFCGLLFPQPRQLLFNHSNLGFGVGFLLAFLVYDGGRSTTHKALVGELGFNALQETLGVFQFLF